MRANYIVAGKKLASQASVLVSMEFCRRDTKRTRQPMFDPRWWEHNRRERLEAIRHVMATGRRYEPLATRHNSSTL